MKDWILEYNHFDPAQEKLREALCTVGNGYFCTRGAAPESNAGGAHYPGTYLAGGYNRLQTEIAGRVIENEDLVNFPNWLPLTFRIEEEPWFDLQNVEILSYHQELDMRGGLLRRTIRFKDGRGRITRLHQQRLVHMRNRHLAVLDTVLTAENWAGKIEFRTALDGRVKNENVDRYKDLANDHLEPLATSRINEETILLMVRTKQSRIEMAQAARTRVFTSDAIQSPPRRLLKEDGYIGQTFNIQLEQGAGVRIEKTVSLFTNRDHAISECSLEAANEISQAPGFEELAKYHSQTWGHLWDRFGLDIQMDNDTNRVRMILRLHIFHLLQSVSFHTIDLDVGVPPRGWHGEAYRGHIFWDELFIFPSLNLRASEITRSLLKYRYRRLPEARAAARVAGYRGAMFPWQSGSNGREESQEIHLNPKSGNWIPDNSRLQRHVNAAIAWNVWQYYQVTWDTEFLFFYGAEMILEIARFFASLATWNEELERYEILGVMGPDEYHDAYPDSDRPGLDNNAYTNIMAAWTLKCALQVLELLSNQRRRELCETLNIQTSEIERWDQISRRMRVVFHGDGIISQFEGYDNLEEFDWETYRAKFGKVMRLDRILEAENDTPNRYKCSKQADVLMLFYLFSAEELGEIFERLGYPFEHETIPKNIHYYIERTSHGSTLSQVVHSWVLSRQDREGSWQLFTEALQADIDDIQGGTTPEGIHLGAMAGTVDLIQRCYTGIEARGDTLRFNPCLPEELNRLQLCIRYRGHTLELDLSPEQLKICCAFCDKEPIQLCFNEERRYLSGGQTTEFKLGSWKTIKF